MPSAEKKIGKICAVTLGTGGYQEAGFGLSLKFESSKDGWGVGAFVSGGWYPGIVDPDKHTRWTEDDRRKSMADLSYKIAEILRQAKVNDISKLKGIPVEVTFENNCIKDWRILEEVL